MLIMLNNACTGALLVAISQTCTTKSAFFLSLICLGTN
jgi:hypothetical protein